MAENQNPTKGQGDRRKEENPHGQNPRSNNPDQTHGRERSMDDPGRGQGDKFEEQLPHGEREGRTR